MDNIPTGRATSRRSPGVVSPSAAAGSASGHRDTHSGYTLMVAGRRTAKSSFLRLLLDTSRICTTATKEQVAGIAKFVQGSSGHTTHVRTASVNIQPEGDTGGPVTLTLVDTPSLDMQDTAALEMSVADILRHVDSRFAESLQDEEKAISGDRHVHLCIYFLDPDDIVPAAVAPPVPAPIVPRARTNSISTAEPEPVILEPPVPSNPLLYRPILPSAEICVIRRLSTRVNVLPVVARADTLTNDRLAAVKFAIRRDLAEAGIGFGIFDTDSHPPFQLPIDPPEHLQPPRNDSTSSLSSLNNRSSLVPASSSSAATSPPTSPINPPLPRLPYALISPEIYSHSDGVPRTAPSRHELVLQYTPSSTPSSTPKTPIARGQFIRTYRWGAVDVLDPVHSDFLPLRAAIFHHMQTLKNYTRDYLFERFRVDCAVQQQHPAHVQMQSHAMPSYLPLPPMNYDGRPVDAPVAHTALNRHPSLAMSLNHAGNDSHAAHMNGSSPERGLPDPVPQFNVTTGKQRTKKINVACNFCRSRKLKCDGGRPACGQCIKRANPCDYMAHNKRRGGKRTANPDTSDGDGEGDGDGDSPEERFMDDDVPGPSKPLSRRSSNVSMLIEDTLHSPVERPDRRSAILGSVLHQHQKTVPPEASLQDPRHPERSVYPPPYGGPPSAPLSVPVPVRPDVETTAKRKRGSNASGRPRAASNYGPKIIACNFCRARKTKCDGVHPACASCARRSLPCNYVTDPGYSAESSSSKKSPQSPPDIKVPLPSISPTASHSNRADHPPPHMNGVDAGSRRMGSPSPKKLRVENGSAHSPT